MATNTQQVTITINSYVPANVVDVKQCGSKQLFVVTLANDVKLLVSYLTVIGFRTTDTWVINARNYSTTTSKQTAWFRNNTKFYTDTRPNDEFIASLSEQLSMSDIQVERYLV